MIDGLRTLMTSRGRTAPPVTLVHYDGNILTLRAPQRLPMAAPVPIRVRAEDGTDVLATLRLLTRETCSEDELTYTAQVEAPVEVRRRLLELYGLTASGAAPGAERRARPRVDHRLRVRSRKLFGFQAVTADLSLDGVRLVAAGEVAPGEVLDLQLQFDHLQYPDMELRAQAVWCRPRDPRSWWVGLRLVDGTPTKLGTLSAFLHDVMEARVRGLTRLHCV